MSVFVKYIPGDSVIHRLSPFSKIFFMMTVWLLSFYTYNPYCIIGLIAYTIALWALARIPYFLQRFKILLMGLSFVFVLWTLVQAFSFAHFAQRTVLFEVPYFGWEFTLEGFVFGVMICGKIFAIVSAVPIVLWTEPMSKFISALSAIKLPYRLVFILGTAFRFMPLIAQTYIEIIDSQKLRGHNIDKFNMIGKLTKAYIPVTVPLMLSLLRGSENLEIAIETRGFGAPVKRTFVTKMTLKASDYAFIVFTAAMAIAMFLYTFYTGTATPLGLFIKSEV